VTITENQTVREIAVENPATVRVFESLGIDYCCGGRRPLTDACAEANVPVERLLEMLRSAGQGAPEDAQPWKDAPLAELAEHIVTRHHGYIRKETPRIEALLEKVTMRHGSGHPELLTVKELFAAMSQELLTHAMKEEQVLFPHIERMEKAAVAGEPAPAAFFGSVRNPIARMLADHDDAGELTARIRKITDNYRLPEGACPTYRALFDGLAEFERDLHQHVHLENNILFPRALQLENRGSN